MSKKLTCFVIIGYGKKTSYANGKHRVLDLDQTYKYLIKPVFDDLGIDCYRAIDKNVNGSIDELMLNEIRDADIALADISTLNANVMWELGVRHALKENYTVMICEKEQMAAIPFDINHFIVHQYVHSEEGIPYEEVERFRGQLKGVIEKMLAQIPPTADSPVFQFLKPEKAKSLASIESSDDLSSNIVNAKENTAAPTKSFAELLDEAELAKDVKDFNKALKLYDQAKESVLSNMALRSNLPFIIARQALCTHKAKPGNKEALLEAKMIIEEVNPKSSMDIEVLGISGGIHKRLFDITEDDEYLETSIWYYDKGFQLKQDYFNGINAVFMLYRKAAELKEEKEEYADIKLKADYINSVVLQVCLDLEKQGKFDDRDDALWVTYTLAEVYHYRNDKENQTVYENKGDALAAELKHDFAKTSYHQQKDSIDEKKLIEL